MAQVTHHEYRIDFTFNGQKHSNITFPNDMVPVVPSVGTVLAMEEATYVVEEIGYCTKTGSACLHVFEVKMALKQ